MNNTATYSIMNRRLMSHHALQCPTPSDSQPVFPILPYKLLFSSDDYLRHLESFTFDHKACQPWTHGDDSANEILYRSTSTQSMNVSCQAAADEFQPSGGPIKVDTPMAISTTPS